MRIEGYKGSKGGGGSAHVATEAPDSLRSKAYARVIDAISEGEVEGLVDGTKSIFLDNTPIQNSDGTYNFTGVTYTERKGTQSQPYVPGFMSVENTVSVSVEVTNSVAVVRQVTNTNINSVIIGIGIPQLTQQNTSNGDLNGALVKIAIDVQSAGAGFVTVVSGDTISGKTTSRYQRSYNIALPAGGAPWDIRVRRLTADSTSSALSNKTYWDFYTEVVDGKLRYPNTALVALSVDSSQFSSIPTRSYDMKLMRVKVPSNYNPTTRAYTGSWDGSFQIAWTDNPAWVFYDMVTSDRYGLGEFIDETQVDKWALYTISKYCDELVPDGFGGQEPRFTCNIYLQSKSEAYKVVNDLASVFRGIVYWASNAVTMVQDSPSDPVWPYTPANVIDGVFTYAGSSASARHTVALVTWNDPADAYAQKVEYVEDRDGIERYGVITTEVAAIGCTSRGQAHRYGLWTLYTERMEAETVSFKTGIEGALCRPGQIITVADPARAGVRFGGRIITPGTDSVTLDAPVTLAAGKSYTFSCLTSSGVMQETSVQHSGGTLSTLTLSPALAEAPSSGAIWVLSGSEAEPQLFRVIVVTENDKNEFEVMALAHEPSKYDAIEKNLMLEVRNYSTLSTQPVTPTNLQATESLYIAGGAVYTRLSLSWSAPDLAVKYVVVIRRDGDNETPETETITPAIDFAPITEGLYSISVWSVNAIGRKCVLPAKITYQVLGKTAPPANVQNFVVARNLDILNFTWDHVADLDLDHYEIRKGATWSTGLTVGGTIANAFAVNAPRGGSFMIKAVDTSGNYSLVETVVIAADVSNINVVMDYNEGDTGFSGAKTNVINAAYGGVPGVTLGGATPWSGYTNTWSTYTAPWYFLDPETFGQYITQSIDIGYVAACAVYIDAAVGVIARLGLTWNDFTQPWQTYAAPVWTWQGQVEQIAAGYEISSSEDGVTWSSWSLFTPGAYSFRYLRFRVTLSTENANWLPFMTAFNVHVDVPDRAEHFEDVSIPVGGATITFSPAFVGVKTVQVTLQSALSGDTFTVTGKSESGVTVKVFDSAGVAKTGSADVDVFGYGSRV